MNDSFKSSAIAAKMSRFGSQSKSAFHAYARWLVSIGWWRFWGWSLLLIITMGILHDIPPLSWTYTEIVQPDTSAKAAATPKESSTPRSKTSNNSNDGVDISIDERGVRIRTRPAVPAAPTVTPEITPATEPASTVPPDTAVPKEPEGPGISIKLPPGADSDAIRQAVEEARDEVRAAIKEAHDEARDAAEEAADAMRPRLRTHRYGDALMPMTMWFILISAVIKFTYKGTVQAEAKAAQATEVAESESLKRQVVEARMAAMQAQVEPHFLFNTLASIDYLIETDPPRASIMQKNLIALLRASMPTMREANAQATRDLGRELAVIRPYLEILKVRMEERLQPEVRVSDGLLSAEFPPMMLQSLVENAIKHGLEPKAEGGQLTVSAEVVHGKLAVSVADTGLGFGKADTSGTGIGLSNIRERLDLLYGKKANLTIAETPGGGTTATITVPYVARSEA
jgi:hypothetical protein